jgi:hypothetical protein
MRLRRREPVVTVMWFIVVAILVAGVLVFFATVPS